MNKRIKSLMVAGLLVVGMNGDVFAYGTFEGNDSNTSIVEQQHEGLFSVKIDSPKANNTYFVKEGENNVIQIDISEDGKHATVQVIDATIADLKHVHMKGGNGFNCYSFGESFSNMECPLNNGGNVSEISHITVFYDICDKTDKDNDGILDFKDDEVVTPPVVEDEPTDPTPNPEEEPKEDPTPEEEENEEPKDDEEKEEGTTPGEEEGENPKEEPKEDPIPEEPKEEEPKEVVDVPLTGDASILPYGLGALATALGLIINRKRR